MDAARARRAPCFVGKTSPRDKSVHSRRYERLRTGVGERDAGSTPVFSIVAEFSLLCALALRA